MTQPFTGGGYNPADPTAPLREMLQDQPFVKRYANTVTTGIGVAVGAVWLAMSAGFEVSETVENWVLVLVGLGTLLGVKMTPNGVTEKQIQEVEQRVGRHRRAD